MSAHPDVAEVPQIETCPSSIAELAVNAGLSKHLSELESRVEALHQSAEVHSTTLTQSPTPEACSNQLLLFA